MSGNFPKQRLDSGRNQPTLLILQDVATIAGVSIKTVSRVVTDWGEASTVLLQRVQTAVHKSVYPGIEPGEPICQSRILAARRKG
jgi:hypothetical protein